MKKYAKDDFYVNIHGLEKCRLMDAYYENESARKETLMKEMTSAENIKVLIGLLNEKTGLNLTYDIDVVEGRDGEKRIKLESSEICNPVIELAWSSFRICFSTGGFWTTRNKRGCSGGEDDFTKFAKEIGYTAYVDFGYERIRLGRNGAEIGKAYFSESEKKWKLKLIKEENDERAAGNH